MYSRKDAKSAKKEVKLHVFFVLLHLGENNIRLLPTWPRAGECAITPSRLGTKPKARCVASSTTIRLVHEDPAHHWSVSNLAEKAGMSRWAFTNHFQAVAGITPMQYVTNWRMRAAFEKLHTGKDSVALIVQQSGYQTEASFRKAFKNQLGIGPGAVRRGNVSPD